MQQFLTRPNTVVYVNDDSNYCVTDFQQNLIATLDPIGFWAWMQIEPDSTVDTIIETIQARYPDSKNKDAVSLVDKLIASGIASIDSKKSDAPAARGSSVVDDKKRIANLNVCFLNFPEVEALNNPILWLLSNCAEMISILGDPDAADLVFHFDAMDCSHNPDTIDILVAREPEKEDVARSDYVFSTREALSPQHLKWLRLPSGCLDFDSRGAGLHRAAFTNGYSIQRLSSRFVDFLVGSESTSTEPVINRPATPLTIGMATYDDYDGVYFSLVSLQLHHRQVFDQVEIIILDNNPDGVASDALAGLARQNENVRYVAYDHKNSTTVRSVLFSLATSPWCLCMDSHVMFPPRTLDRLLDYIQKHPHSNDLLQGPLLNDAGEPFATHFIEEWRAGMYGCWGWDERAADIDGQPFEIRMQGLGVFACRTAAWPGLNRLFNGFGGEEGYLHEKIRQNGGKCLCLPWLQWSHRFARPHGARYTVSWKDRIHNYLVGWDEIGYDTSEVKKYFSDFVGPGVVEEVEAKTTTLSKSPFGKIDFIACINIDSETQRWEQMQSRLNSIDILDRVKRVSAIHTPEFHHTGCALTHRTIIEQAKLFGYESVLVLEDDAMLLSGAEIFLSFALEELENKSWKILYLGGYHGKLDLQYSQNCQYLMDVSDQPLTTTHALIYHRSVYDEILQALPDNEKDTEQWVVNNFAIDQYLCSVDSRFLVFPKPFTQPNVRIVEDSRYRPFYR